MKTPYSWVIIPYRAILERDFSPQLLLMTVPQREQPYLSPQEEPGRLQPSPAFPFLHFTVVLPVSRLLGSTGCVPSPRRRHRGLSTQHSAMTGSGTPPTWRPPPPSRHAPRQRHGAGGGGVATVGVVAEWAWPCRGAAGSIPAGGAAGSRVRSPLRAVGAAGGLCTPVTAPSSVSSPKFNQQPREGCTHRVRAAAVPSVCIHTGAEQRARLLPPKRAGGEQQLPFSGPPACLHRGGNRIQHRPLLLRSERSHRQPCGFL